jgi:hypothetical protein
MGASLNSRMTESPDEYTLTEDYRAFIESVRTYIKTAPSTRTLIIASDVGYVYRGNLTAFLLDQGVPLEDHYVLLRVNDLSDMTAFDEKTTTLLAPDQMLVASLKQAYRTRLV